MSHSDLQPPDLLYPDVVYPESDGQPMAESDLHRDLMLALIEAAKHHFHAAPDVYISGNLFIYFEQGNPKMCVAPDFFFVRGVPKERRRTYKIWEEKKGPQVAIELTSPSTHLEDLGKKRAIYEQLGVEEYYIFDPEGIRFDPRFRCFRLRDGVLQPVSVETRPDGSQVLLSEVMGLEVHAIGDQLRFVDPQSGETLLDNEELRATASTERARAKSEKARAESEKARAESEKARAESEKARAEAAEAELARLRAELEGRE